MIRYPDILETRLEAQPRWRRRDSMLYALGLGYGEDPLNEAELKLVAEPNNCAFPTLCAVMAAAASPIRDSGINYRLGVHMEQLLEIHSELPSEGSAKVTTRISAAYDRGEGRGAIVIADGELREATTGRLIATSQSISLARGDGGFGGPKPPTPLRSPLPSRAPDAVVNIKTRPGQALLYRLSGDYNPIHSNPAAAREAGFERPILHGLCTYGIAARAVLNAFGQDDPTCLKAHRARFTAPVFPGDVIPVSMWREDASVLFDARIEARDVTVLKDGVCKLGEV
jgi:acyl dehydratase